MTSNSRKPLLRLREQTANVVANGALISASTKCRVVSTSEWPMGQLMEPISIASDEFQVVGITARTTNRIEAVHETARIPVLWRRFFAEKVAEALPDRLSDDGVIVVYTDFDDESRGAYTVIIGYKVPQSTQPPSGMGSLTVGAGHYLRFPLPDRSCESMIDTWNEIRRFFLYSHEYERAFTAEVEVHRAHASEIFVSVK